MSMSQFASLDAYKDFLKANQPSTSSKPVVKYRSAGDTPVVGDVVNMFPVDHPSDYLNGRLCHSSLIVAVGGDGNFETVNTRYVLVD